LAGDPVVVPPCCHLSRRQLLRWAAVVAASPLLGALDDPERAYAATGPAVGLNLELVTLTETSAILTWYTGDPTRLDDVHRPTPVPADTEVLLGTSPSNLRQAFHDAKPTPYHYVELTGLEPGQTYYYVARSNGLAAVPSIATESDAISTTLLDALPAVAFTFTTPQPPPGRLLFAIALCNDMHLGETVAGLAKTVNGIEIPPGIRQSPGLPPYSEVMASALGPEARARGANVIVANGDVTSEAAGADAIDAKRYLDVFGAQHRDYFVTRGNHDRPHTGPKSATCRAVPGAPGYHDCFREEFFPTDRTWWAAERFGLRLVGLDTYDKIGNGADGGVMSAEQLAFVREQLASEPDRPTLVAGHHPVTLESTVDNLEPVINDLNTSQSTQLEQLYGRTPGVFLHHAGHTHRNKRTLSLNAPHVVFQEVSAVKEYPGGFHLLRVFSGGFALNFYKFRAPLAQEWAERSRQQYVGGVSLYTLGTPGDRNYVAARDFSGLTSADALPAPAIPERVLPVTGQRPHLELPAAALAAVAAERWLRRRRSAR
jgi:calcineurin-like phosphoesterase family protein/purple acid phosphatase-like protein